MVLVFASAVPLLKVGGELVYSTCTMHPEENEGNVAWALEQYPCLELMDIDENLKLGSIGLPYRLTESQRKCVQRFLPTNQTLDTNAFFIAKFRKISG